VNVHVITLFPEIFDPIISSSILKKARAKKLIKINLVNPRSFATDKRKTVDDRPYGGGAGMVLKVDVLHKALASIHPKPYTILLAASGKKYTQNNAKELAKRKNIALICGHYEGVDARIEKYVDEIFSIGDYVLTGGEIPAMLVIDSVTRCISGVINPNSPKDESFENGLLEYPQFTKPKEYKGSTVPKVLLGGNHKEIQKWRLKEAIKRTKKFRPDLLQSK
jgi:tRNA (guanine37-N1)-methyltransferase